MATGKYVVPTPQTASTFGLLNLIFGGVFLLVGTLMLSSAMMTPLFRGPAESISKAIKVQVTEDHEKVIARLRDLEEQAETDGERQIYRRGREKVESDGAIEPVGSELMSIGFTDESLTRWTWLDSMTSIPLNLAMIAAGLGLLQMGEWGRKLSLWVAGLKIARILLVQGYFIFGVVPGFSKRLGVMAEEMISQAQAGGGGGGAPVGIDFGMIYLVTYTVMGILTILFVLIYPIISLVALRRLGVRAACLPVRPIDPELGA